MDTIYDLRRVLKEALSSELNSPVPNADRVIDLCSRLDAICTNANLPIL